jgi:hypothetical protein
MNFDLLLENLTNPALLFFILGVLAVYLRSDLEIPYNSSKFISLYLLFSFASVLVTHDPSNRFIFGILAASASYIAVPAAMKIAAPKSNPGLLLPMALAVTFPMNITVGMPLYWQIVQMTM